MSKCRLSICLSICLTAFTYTKNCKAELTEDISLLSPKAISLAHAVTADTPGIDSIHFNPAGLLTLNRSQKVLKLGTVQQSLISKTGSQEVDPEVANLYEAFSGTTYPNDPVANGSSKSSDTIVLLPGGNITDLPIPIVPVGGIAIKHPSSKFAFGTAVYSPMMVGIQRSDDDVGRYQGRQSTFTRLTYLSPTFAYQITDTFGIGVGLNISYQGMGMDFAIRSPQASTAVISAFAESLTGEAFGPAPYDDLTRVSIILEDYFSLGFNVGALWKPYEWVSFGINYRSETTSSLEGDYTFTYTNELLTLTDQLASLSSQFSGARTESGKAKMKLTLPQHLSFGASIQVLPSLKVNFDIQKSYYSEWESFEIEFDQNIDFLTFGSLLDSDATPNSLTLQRNYQNTLSWSIGCEYALSDTMGVRLGYQFRASAIPDDAKDLSMPMAEADFYGSGFYYQTQDAYIEFGVGYLTSEQQINVGQSNNANSSDPYDLLYNPYVYLPLESKVDALVMAISYSQEY